MPSALPLGLPMSTSTGKVRVASALGVYAGWLLHESGPTPDHCGAWQVGALDSPKGDIAPAMPAVWRYQIYTRKEK